MKLVDHLPGTDLGFRDPLTVNSIASLFAFAAAQAVAVVGSSVPLWWVGICSQGSGVPLLLSHGRVQQHSCVLQPAGTASAAQ